MKMVEYFDTICLKAEAEDNKEKWLRAAAVALLIADRKNAKHLAAYWAEEAVGCIAEADPKVAEEEFDKLLYCPAWEARDEVTALFERKYFPIAEALP